MKILWNCCAHCDYSALERVPRKPWMRLLPSFRHYRCSQCQCKLLARKDVVEARQWMQPTFRGFQPPQPRNEER